MGICESNKNQNNANPTQTTPTTTNISQNTPIANISQTPSPEPIPQNTVPKLEQNINSNSRLIINNTNLLNATEHAEINKQFSQFLEDNEKQSDYNGKVSMGSSISNDDSIGYNQTRNTVVN